MKDKILPDIRESQWYYYRHWLKIALTAEAVMLVFNHSLFEIYCLIAVLFLIGFLLRILGLYPGQREPFILDFSAVVLSLVYSFLARWLGDCGWRFLLIFCSSGILIPHFIYIAWEK